VLCSGPVRPPRQQHFLFNFIVASTRPFTENYTHLFCRQHMNRMSRLLCFKHCTRETSLIRNAAYSTKPKKEKALWSDTASAASIATARNIPAIPKSNGLPEVRLYLQLSSHADRIVAIDCGHRYRSVPLKM